MSSINQPSFLQKAMGADKLFKNTPNAPKFICPNCLPKPRSLGFWWKKASLGVRSPWSLPKGDWKVATRWLNRNDKNLTFAECHYLKYMYDEQEISIINLRVYKTYWASLLFTFFSINEFSFCASNVQCVIINNYTLYSNGLLAAYYYSNYSSILIF